MKLGRPPKGPRSSEKHKVRPEVSPNHPLLVTLRAVDEVGRLRNAAVYRAVREAMVVALARENCRIVHLSIQHNHLHLLVEADDRMALAKGMQAFESSAARHINSELSKGRLKGVSWYEAKRRGLLPANAKRRKGTVFPDRYNAQILRTPRQVRNAIGYVLNNWRKHREDKKQPARGWKIDPFSTGWAFDGWAERADEPFVWKLRDTYDPMPSWRPQTWLLGTGWRRWGLVSVGEVPGSRATLVASARVPGA